MGKNALDVLYAENYLPCNTEEDTPHEIFLPHFTTTTEKNVDATRLMQDQDLLAFHVLSFLHVVCRFASKGLCSSASSRSVIDSVLVLCVSVCVGQTNVSDLCAFAVRRLDEECASGRVRLCCST